jgi:peptide/nickel transport system permease protein
LQLSVLALLVALLVGVPLGTLAALRHGSLVDQAIRVFSVAGHAIPPFWLGLLFILTFSVGLRLVPVGGMLTIGASSWDVGDRLLHLVGPVLTLSLAGIANYTRYLRTEALEVLAQDYVRTARAKGLRGQTVLMAHVLRNALLPIVTALGGVLATVVSGALVVEQVFAWPGMGRLMFDAARAKDYPVIMGVVVMSSALLLLSYLLRDIVYGIVDPRVSRR